MNYYFIYNVLYESFKFYGSPCWYIIDKIFTKENVYKSIEYTYKNIEKKNKNIRNEKIDIELKVIKKI